MASTAAGEPPKSGDTGSANAPAAALPGVTAAMAEADEVMADTATAVVTVVVCGGMTDFVTGAEKVWSVEQRPSWPTYSGTCRPRGDRRRVWRHLSRHGRLRGMGDGRLGGWGERCCQWGRWRQLLCERGVGGRCAFW